MTTKQAEPRVAPRQAVTTPSGDAERRIGRRMWERFSKPAHYRAVSELRVSLMNRDRARIAALLRPDVALLIDGGRPESDERRLLVGARDATTMLLHGTTDEPGLEVLVRSVNSQAGLLVMRGTETIATILVDYSAGLVSTLWVRLHPPTLRRWNKV